MARRLAAIMFSDLVGFTASAQSNERAALARLQEEQKLVEPVFTSYGGRVVKSTGDGYLVEFESALRATECAVEVQRRLRERNSIQPSFPIEVRIGIHVGDIEEQGSDILGDAVNVAARVVPLAEPGGVCLTAQAYDQVRNKVACTFEALGAATLKGVREPLPVFRAVLPWAALTVAPPSAGPPRIAVLPLANISPDPKDEYFADGLTEELITALSQIKGLRVISRTSINQYRGTSKPVGQIGLELGADSVLEGSVRKAGDQLRIAVQLIDTRTDEHRWAQTFDRRLENVFAIQAEVAEHTAGALKVQLLKSERETLQERTTSNLRAYEAYLRGIQAFRSFKGWDETQRWDREAIRQFETAIREDPEFSAAYSALANYLLAVMGIVRSLKESVPRARELTAKALSLTPDSYDAHTAMGNLAFQGDLDWSQAEREFKKAISLNPSNVTARFWHAFLLTTLQRFEESSVEYLQVIELDPLWLLPRSNLNWLYYDWGKMDTAISSGERTVDSFPEEPTARFQLASLNALAGREKAARALIEPFETVTTLDARIGRADVLSALGDMDELRKLLDDYEAGRFSHYIPLPGLAAGYARLGDGEKALELLERDYREGDRVLWNSYQSPAYDSIREDPRFVALLREMNLPTSLRRPVQNTRERPASRRR